MPSPFIHKMPPKPSRKAALPKPAKKGRKRAGARKKKATTGADDLMADIKRDLAFAEADRLQDAVRAKFRKFDADSSGFIDMQEMSGIMQELGFVDTDGDSFSMFLDEEFKACDVRIARLRWHSPIVTPHPFWTWRACVVSIAICVTPRRCIPHRPIRLCVTPHAPGRERFPGLRSQCGWFPTSLPNMGVRYTCLVPLRPCLPSNAPPGATSSACYPGPRPVYGLRIGLGACFRCGLQCLAPGPPSQCPVSP